MTLTQKQSDFLNELRDELGRAKSTEQFNQTLAAMIEDMDDFDWVRTEREFQMSTDAETALGRVRGGDFHSERYGPQTPDALRSGITDILLAEDITSDKVRFSAIRQLILLLVIRPTENLADLAAASA